MTNPVIRGHVATMSEFAETAMDGSHEYTARDRRLARALYTSPERTAEIEQVRLAIERGSPLVGYGAIDGTPFSSEGQKLLGDDIYWREVVPLSPCWKVRRWKR